MTGFWYPHVDITPAEFEAFRERYRLGILIHAVEVTVAGVTWRFRPIASGDTPR